MWSGAGPVLRPSNLVRSCCVRTTLRVRLCAINPTEGLRRESLMRFWRAARAGLAAAWRTWHADGVGDDLRRACMMELAQVGDAELDQLWRLFCAESKRRGLL